MKTKFLFLLLSIFMVVSCYNDESHVVETSISDEEDSIIDGKISLYRAIDNADFVYKSIEGVDFRRRSIRSVDVLTRSDLNVNVADTRFVSTSDENEQPLAYVVNYENNGGYAILAADVQLPPVICVGDEGSFSTQDFIAFTQNNISTRSSIIRDNAQEIQYALISNSLLLPSIEIENFPISGVDTTVILKCLPLVPTKWKQRDPYNFYAPLDPSSGEKCLAGCVPIAAAQTLTSLCYHHNWRPTTQISDNYSVDWYALNRMIYADTARFAYGNYSSNALNVASLIRAVGENVDANYTDSVTTAYTSRLISTFQQFGMNSVVYGNNSFFSKQKVTEEDIFDMIIVKNYPVIASAQNSVTGDDGHTFVLDGWLRLEYSILSLIPDDDDNSSLTGWSQFDNVQYRFDLVHVNFGWNGSYDGYFLLGAFDLTEDEYHDYAEENDIPYTTTIVYDLNVDYLKYDI